MDKKSFSQWHVTNICLEGNKKYFKKQYIPNSFEMKNELKWLLSPLLDKKEYFSVPKVVDYSLDKGEILMEYINIKQENSHVIFQQLVNCAFELHTILKSKEPSLRTNIKGSDYNAYLLQYVESRFETLENNKIILDEEIKLWITKLIRQLRSDYFSIVHRDMRSRHLLFSHTQKPILIDWEFANISFYSQDIAKLIYDVVLDGFNFDRVIKSTIKNYSEKSNISQDKVMSDTNVFLPIIPLEHAASLVYRKVDGIEPVLQKDLQFISNIYEKYAK